MLKSEQFGIRSKFNQWKEEAKNEIEKSKNQ